MNLKDRMSGKLNGQSEECAVVNTTGALAPVDSNYIALKNNALEIINENLKNQPLSFSLFDVVKSPSGGATVFSVPGIAGEEAVKELTGIILDYTTPRAYWDTPDPIEGTPPVCFSRDSIISHGRRSVQPLRVQYSRFKERRRNERKSLQGKRRYFPAPAG